MLCHAKWQFHSYLEDVINDPQSLVVGRQAKEGVTKAMFEGTREPIEAGGHIWDSTVITSYLSE